ncbi:hypothetical protein EAV90_28015 [Bradyrhizobium vignae]|nr:hypothetical protein EAV90_28015 [Bradyrhizobium vignae]
MGQVLHGCATTTEAVRRAIQNKWKQRDNVAHSRDGDQWFQTMVITDSSDRDHVRKRTRLTIAFVLEMASWSRLLEIVPAVHGRAPCAARSAPTSDGATRAGGACGPAGRSRVR